MTPESFLQLSDLLPEPMLLVTAGGDVVALNRASRDRLGLPPVRDLAGAVAEPPDEVARYLRACSRSRQMVIGALTVRGGAACRAEGAVIRPASDGAEALVLLRLVPKQSAAGQFVALNQRIDNLGREVHRRKAAEEAIRRQEERFRVTLASIGDAVIATDAEGRVTFLNPVAEALTGWCRADALGRPLPDVFRIVNERTRAPAENPALRALREGTVVGLANHTVLLARDGTERPIDDSAAPIQDGVVEPAGAVLVFRDVSDRKREEETRARLAAIVASSDDAIVGKTLDGVIRSWNAGAERIFGYTAAEAVGRPITLIIPPERLDEERDILARLVRGERIDHFETVRVAKDGRRLDISLTVSPLRDADGHVIGASKVARDVTERRRIEAALRERDERLHLFLGNATDYAVIISDPDDRVTEWLGGAEQITGWRLDEVVGGPVEVIFTPEDRAAGVPGRETGKAAATGRAEDVRWHQRKDGSRFFAEGVTVAIRGPGGGLRGFGKVFRDATARKRAEDELVRRTERLRILWEAASVLLTTDEPDAMLRGLFAKIAAHLGLDVYFNYMATEAGDALRLESAAGVSEEVRGAVGRLAFGQAVCGTVALTREAMAVPHVQDSDDPRVELVKGLGVRAYACNPLVAGGRVLGTLSFGSRTRDAFEEDELEFLRTVTHYVTVAYERLRLIGELREADRKKDDFIALLAHELRNPLAPVRNGLQVLRRSDDRAVRERSQGMMDRQLTHMVRLIDDLLDVSRIGRNKMELRRARVALADVVSAAVETASPLIQAEGHELTVALPGVPVYLDADLTRLAQVFGNLLTNSAKYTPKGGRIWLSAERRGPEVVASVRDTGIGIPPESLPTIFDMFSQVDRSIERATGGLGIGLALVRGLVEMHGGAVSAASAGENQGSTFTVTLPVLTGAAAATAPEDVGAVQAGGRRILVVDDNRDGAESMADMLGVLGNEVRTARDGVEGVAAAEAFRPEVILMDVGMPRLNGLDATRRIREQPWGKGITIIALTGWGQENDREKSREAGCDGHLVKPVNLPDLERLLAGVPG